MVLIAVIMMSSQPRYLPPPDLPSTPVSRPSPAVAVAPPVTSPQPELPKEQRPLSSVAQTDGQTVKPSSANDATPVLSLPELIQRVEPAVVMLEVEKENSGSQGSGYIVSKDGMTVTNHHVMAGAKRCTARFADGKIATCKGFRLLRPREDIAIIQLDLGGQEIEPLTIADELPLKGADVVGFGSPQGLSFTTSTGIISGIRDSELLAEELGTDYDGTWLQTTCPTSEGSSGGPLCDRMGRVVGMSTMGHSEGQNLNFAISCLQIAAAIQEAPELVQTLDPKKIKDYDSSIAARDLPKEIGTERGKRLLGTMSTAIVVDPLPMISTLLDPRRIVQRTALTYCKNAVERAEVKVLDSGSKPTGVSGILLVILDCEEPVKGRYGLQTLFIKLVFIVKDPAASSKSGKLSIVWKDEEKLGTIALKSLAAGDLPKTFKYQQQLYQLVQRLESSIREAQESQQSSSGSPNSSADPANREKPAAKKDDDEDNPFAPKSKK